MKLTELIKNSVVLSPGTMQKARDHITITNLVVVDMVGMKTKIVTGDVASDRGGLYRVGVQFRVGDDGSYGDVLVRCSCAHFGATYERANATHKALFGRMGHKAGSNKYGLPGVCKHIVACIERCAIEIND